MDQQPKIPTLKDAQKPQVKVKGLGAGLTLFDRLKGFKKKDLAFILAGLGTLFMAPLAEHFMMAPENGSSDLQSGFRGSSSGGGIFGSGSSPYESGNNSIAQGGAIGGAGAVLSRFVKRVEVVAYEDLGTEAIRRLEVEGFPAIVVNDCHGGDLYQDGIKAYAREEK